MSAQRLPEPMLRIEDCSKLSTPDLLNSTRGLLAKLESTQKESAASKANSTFHDRLHKYSFVLYALLFAIIVFAFSMAHNKDVRRIDTNTASLNEVVKAAKAKAEFDKAAVKGLHISLPAVILKKQDDAMKHLDNAERIQKGK